MNYYTNSIDEVIHYLSKLPTIGRKSATKMALKILEMDDEFVVNFAKSIINMKKNTHHCKICGNLTENEICNICSDEKRDKSTIAIVEDIFGIVSLEKTKIYRGMYHVLNGLVVPRDGITLDDLNVSSLISRIEKENVKEVIFAISQTIDGELTELYIIDLLKKFKDLKISKIANGIPIGRSVENYDELTFIRALEDRKEVEY
ncbi:hypothetical protein HMPREF3188_00644 [Tissierellia bacterium KA00581]|nr:hypothetical protein HMPREF3188_00644 [Tissierellia bacterium KA00581]